MPIFESRLESEHLKVDKKSYSRISHVLKGKTKPKIHELDKRERIRFRIEAVEMQAQVIHDIQDIDAATADSAGAARPQPCDRIGTHDGIGIPTSRPPPPTIA